MFFINLKQNVNGFLPCASRLYLLVPQPSVSNSSKYFSAGLSKNSGTGFHIFCQKKLDLSFSLAASETFKHMLLREKKNSAKKILVGQSFFVNARRFGG
jgi:hypothetical protein